MLLTTYMEMKASPAGAPLSNPLAEVRIERETLGPADYLDIWRSVGEPLRWDGRLGMSPLALHAFLGAPTTHLYILRRNESPIGLCEFDRAGEADIELTHFGLIPQAQGRRLGPYLLDQHCAGSGPCRPGASGSTPIPRIIPARSPRIGAQVSPYTNAASNEAERSAADGGAADQQRTALGGAKAGHRATRTVRASYDVQVPAVRAET